MNALNFHTPRVAPEKQVAFTGLPGVLAENGESVKEIFVTRRTEGPSAQVRIRVMKRDRFQCTYCGAPGTDAELEIDHIIPVSKGGSHHISNLTTACRSCNQQKSDGEAPARTSTKTKSTQKAVSLVGMFLHTFKEGRIQYQGQIIGKDDGVFLVQLYSWILGEPTNVMVMAREKVLSDECALYATAEDWKWAVEKEARARGEWYD